MNALGFVGVLVILTQSKELAAVTCCGHEIYMVCLCSLGSSGFLFILHAVDQGGHQQLANLHYMWHCNFHDSRTVAFSKLLMHCVDNAAQR